MNVPGDRTMAWQDFGDTADGDDRPAISLGDLRSGETVTLEVAEEPEMFDSEEYGEGVRVPVKFVESDYTFETTTGAGEEVEVDEGMDVVLITWSKRLVRALRTYAEENGALVGETVTIEKKGSGYDTTYSVESAA